MSEALDPARGSGNFLGDSMRRLVNSQRKIIIFTADVGPPSFFPKVGPEQVHAILAHDEQSNPVEPEWPEADVIVGNPPFLGGSKMPFHALG